jgi:hypothetical protein
MLTLSAMALVRNSFGDDIINERGKSEPTQSSQRIT